MRRIRRQDDLRDGEAAEDKADEARDPKVGLQDALRGRLAAVVVGL